MASGVDEAVEEGVVEDEGDVLLEVGLSFSFVEIAVG